MSHAWDCEVFCERYAENYPYSMMISQENAAHKLTGQLTVISRTPFEEYHRHLAIFLKRALCLVAGREGGAEQSSVAQSLFEDFLLGKHTDAASFHTFYQMQGWKPENYCMIVLLGKENMAIAACTYHVRRCGRRFKRAFLYRLRTPGPVRPGNRLLPAFGKPKETDYGQPVSGGNTGGFFKLAERTGLDYFCSYPFTGVEHLAGQYVQAKTCRDRGEKFYYACALRDLAGLESSEEVRRLALHRLWTGFFSTTGEKGTSFYEILKVYLRCERNRVLTARQLFVHKNTLVYRLEKMVRLFSLDLDDSYEREYLLFSIRCLDEDKTAGPRRQ